MAIAINPAVTLLQSIGIIRKIEMDQVKAMFVQIETFSVWMRIWNSGTFATSWPSQNS